MEEVAGEKRRLYKRGENRHFLIGIIYALIVIAAIIVLVVTLFPVLQVTGNSMEPTLKEGNIVIIRKTDHYETGDICAFYYDNKILLKRVIGVPGDTVDMDDHGNISVNGELLKEDYITEKNSGDYDIVFPCEVPEDCYFVMGDNRSVSIDSRSSLIGFVDKDKMAGKVLFKLWPAGPIAG